MEVYNGLVCFDGSKDVRFGSLTRQDKEIEFKFRKAAWPKEKKYYTGYMNSATDRKPKNKASNFIDISNYNESRLTDRFVYNVISYLKQIGNRNAKTM